MTGLKTLERDVRKAAKGADVGALATQLGKLVAARLSKRQKAVQAAASMGRPDLLYSAADRAAAQSVMAEATFPRRKRSLRRRGRTQSYVATTKVDTSRLGTFRHYMLKLIREHSDTWSAERAHATCENPKFAKNRLDFSWAASEGYIDFIL